jgi:hypothetical protein
MNATMFKYLFLLGLIAYVAGQSVTISTDPTGPDPLAPTISVDESINITCTTSGNAFIPNLVVTPSSTINEITPADAQQRMRVWQFSPDTREDNGIAFFCMISGTNIVSDTVLLNVSFSPTISNIMITNGSVGDQVTVIFTVDANPQVVANDISITGPGTANNVNINGDQVTVTFSNLMRSDAGDYVVTVTNTEGSDNAAFSLNVFFGPNYLLQPSDTINATVGVTLILNCSVESNPPATVTFTTTASTTSNVAINPTTGIVTITNTALGNTGDYTCIANNGENVNNQTFNVRIGDVPTEMLTITSISYDDETNQLMINYTQSNRDSSILRYEVSCVNCPGFISLINYTLTLPPSPIIITIPSSVLPSCSTTRYNIEITVFNIFGRSVIGSEEFTCPVPPSPSPSPGDSTGLVGTTLLVMVLGTITTAMIH